jgi:hypothetical protein
LLYQAYKKAGVLHSEKDKRKEMMKTLLLGLTACLLHGR